MITFLWGFVSCRPQCTQSRCSTFITTLIDSLLCHCICIFFLFLFIIPLFTSESNQSSFRPKAASLCDMSLLYFKVLHCRWNCFVLLLFPSHLRFVLVTVAASFCLITSSVTRAWRLSHLHVIHAIWQKQQSLLGQGLSWKKEDEVSSAWSGANCQRVSICWTGLNLLMELFDKYVSVTPASFTGFPLCTVPVWQQGSLY